MALNNLFKVKTPEEQAQDILWDKIKSLQNKDHSAEIKIQTGLFGRSFEIIIDRGSSKEQFFSFADNLNGYKKASSWVDVNYLSPSMQEIKDVIADGIGKQISQITVDIAGSAIKDYVEDNIELGE